MSPESKTIYYRDVDQDGYGQNDDLQAWCHAPADIIDTHSILDGDCNDNDPWTYPEANELCDGADNNCDGYVNDEDGLATFISASGDSTPYNTISGPEKNPYLSNFDEDGTLNVCSGTHYVNLNLLGGLNVDGYRRKHKGILSCCRWRGRCRHHIRTRQFQNRSA